MALIQCPECKKEISDHAKKCPHCGYPIKKTSRNLAIFIFCSILIISGAIVWLATHLISSSNETQSAEATAPYETTTDIPETQIINADETTVSAETAVSSFPETTTQTNTNRRMTRAEYEKYKHEWEKRIEKGLIPQPYPENGAIFKGYKIWMDDGLFGTPITVRSGQENIYYIKLIGDFEDSGFEGRPYSLEFFLWDAEETTVYVPDGNYTIHYAVGTRGTNWYGTSDLFGDYTQYYELDQTLSCNYDDDSEYTLTLNTEDGNTFSEKISVDDF